MYILLVDISCQKVHDPWPFIYMVKKQYTNISEIQKCICWMNILICE